jgi:hypothetical protein
VKDRVLTGAISVLLLALVVTPGGNYASAEMQRGGKGKGTTDSLARADFRDSRSPLDGITSDGVALPDACGPFDYVGRDDPCWEGSGETPHRNTSRVSNGRYFLRTVAWQEPLPTRWLVLDFSDPDPEGEGSPCPELDSLIASYEGRYEGAFSPETTEYCIDWVEVRFLADEAFTPGASETPVRIIIDGPDLLEGSRKNPESTVQWNEHFRVEFVNPLTVLPAGADTVLVGADGDDFRAELWSVGGRGKKDQLLGMYNMPFLLTIALVP